MINLNLFYYKASLYSIFFKKVVFYDRLFMKKKYTRYTKIHYTISTVPFYKKISGLRFRLGFSRITGKKSLRIGRFSFLHSDFSVRTPEQNTRSPLNPELLGSLPEKYSFIIISDMHIKKNDKRMLERLQKACIPGDAFLVCNGDLTNSGSKEELQYFSDTMQAMPIPCYPVIGNHDIYHQSWPIWQELMGESIYRIDSGNTTLIMLDSANGILGKNQLIWLEQQLQTRKKNVFIFSHCNFFIPHYMVFQQFANFVERTQFINICDSKVDAVFTGHSHRQYSHIAKNVRYINIEDFRDKGSFCRVHVSLNKIQCTYATIADID